MRSVTRAPHFALRTSHRAPRTGFWPCLPPPPHSAIAFPVTPSRRHAVTTVTALLPDAEEPQYLPPALHENAMREEGRKEGNRQHILGKGVEPAEESDPAEQQGHGEQQPGCPGFGKSDIDKRVVNMPAVGGERATETMSPDPSRDRTLQPASPVAWPSGLMRKRNHKYFCIALENDHRIAKSSERKSFYTTNSGNARQHCQRHDFFFEHFSSRSSAASIARSNSTPSPDRSFSYQAAASTASSAASAWMRSARTNCHSCEPACGAGTPLDR